MKLSIRKYFSINLTRNFDHHEGFRQYFIMIGPFTAIPSICNQRSLLRPTKSLSFYTLRLQRQHLLSLQNVKKCGKTNQVYIRIV